MSGQSKSSGRFDLTALRAKIANGESGPVWRSFDELAENEEFLEYLQAEFPRQASTAGLNRRSFLKLMAASLGLAGLTSCLPKPIEEIVPYVNAPEALTPGQPLYFATAMTLGGYGRGLIVKSQMGRPIKVDGNPDHPASLGATEVFAQAEVLTLYDPDRSQVIRQNGETKSWENFSAALQDVLQQGGAGLRLLTGAVSSPTLSRQIQDLLSTYPQARWHVFEPAGRDFVRSGAELAFGEPVETTYRFDQADVILSLDADFMFREPGSLRYVHDFTQKRSVLNGQAAINRLYAVESAPTITGAMADHRLTVNAGQVEAVARVIAGRLGIQAAGGELPENVPAGWVDSLVTDLQSGSSLVIAGPQQTPVVHALSHLINTALGNAGQTVLYSDPIVTGVAADGEQAQFGSLEELVSDLDAGAVNLLVILGENPAFTAHADLDFAGKMEQAGTSVYLGLFEDETAQLSDWIIPATHFLEMWSDVRAFDGTISLVQPLIEPLYDSHSAHELLALLLGQPQRNGYEIVRGFWQDQAGAGSDFETQWKKALNDGLIPGSALETRPLNPSPDFLSQEGANGPNTGSPSDGLELIFAPDYSIWDGRYANNAWLQELPRPLTKLTWDNPVMISPGTAAELGLENGSVVTLRYRGRELQAPVWILPGQPDGSVTMHLGYGRTAGGSVLEGAGVNAYALRTSDAPWFGYGLEIEPTGKTYELATTQNHQSMEGRHLVRVGTLEEYRQNPGFAQETEPGELPSLYPEFEYPTYAWGMSINLNTCIGCNACVVACQAENNIPVVGKDQVENGREMHWLRIDRYYEGDPANPNTLFQPVPCMHCEKAPCEPVCPVEATVHSSEGLNEMVYNRCVGTRYCSNNCPYKVRRFNFLDYIDENDLSLKLLRNPDVTVRSRGVMEKCTYCVQRIDTARGEAKKEGRTIQDGEVKTACQQACPANAIIFGDINDPNALVSQRKAEPRNYALLAELNTQPRTTYLAKLRNPNPAFGEGESHT